MTDPTGRALDIVLAGVGLAIGSPLLAAAALAIRLESRGPAFYKQRRVGKGGEPFELWKLRTMVPGAEAMGAGIYVLEGDPRITRVGRLLRRLSLDELPNLVNVLKGDMAIVGPRPTIQEQVDRYTDRQQRRLDVKPGITGWAQVNGRTSPPWPERIELDIWYVENRSLRLDLRILARTVRMLVTGTASTARTATRAGTSERLSRPAPTAPRVRAVGPGGDVVAEEAGLLGHERAAEAPTPRRQPPAPSRAQRSPRRRASTCHSRRLRGATVPRKRTRRPFLPASAAAAGRCAAAPAAAGSASSWAGGRRLRWRTRSVRLTRGRMPSEKPPAASVRSVRRVRQRRPRLTCARTLCPESAAPLKDVSAPVGRERPL